jgi:hypothetical protein
MGQPGRDIAIRYKEYIRYIRTNTPTLPYVLHILNQQHEYGCLDQTLQLLQTCDKGNLVNLWETFYIQQLSHMDILIPEQQPQEPNPLFALGSVPSQFAA